MSYHKMLTAVLRLTPTIALLLPTLLLPQAACGQSVCLPAPRLLTLTPMGGTQGSAIEVTVTGDHIEGTDALLFSHAGITAVPALDAEGLPVEGKWQVTVAPDCPVGIYDARLMTRMGISSPRAFSVNRIPEVTRTVANTTPETAMPLELDTICNANCTARAVDFYRIKANAGDRLIIDCAAQGIDSKMKPVVILADKDGNDLMVERRGGILDYTVAETGEFVLKVNDLTFNGGPHYFYRLAVTRHTGDGPVRRQASTRSVGSFSWPPHGLSDDRLQTSVDQQSDSAAAVRIELPCDLTGSFFPAADVDTYEFTAAKGEEWWVEIASERLGCPTDPFIVVQQVVSDGTTETLTDVAEFNDIPSPVKVSSNGYAYDGPPYNSGSTDALGKLTIPEDGTYRIQIRDLFGGTRNDPTNTYRLIVRKAAPDFSVVAWAMHMQLRNGDRNALSKPVALRAGAVMPFEVVVIGRDGFSSDVELRLENLPEGVTASGLTIPAGESRGTMLITAEVDAPRGFSTAQFTARTVIDGTEQIRQVHVASMAWPVPNAWAEIPAPRLVAEFPVSCSNSELAPLSISGEEKVWEVTEGEDLVIPLTITKRCEFSGSNITLKTLGAPFERNAAFDADLTQESASATIRTAAAKAEPGEYTIAFYGSAVAKYQDRLFAVELAEEALRRAEAEATEAGAEAARTASELESAADEQQAAAKAEMLAAKRRETAAVNAVKKAKAALTAAERVAKAKDIVDIVVSRPVRIRVNPKPAPEQNP